MSNKENRPTFQNEKGSFYDADFEYRDEAFPKANHTKQSSSEKPVSPKQSTFDQSLQQVKSLFSSARDANKVKGNPYKKTTSSLSTQSSQLNPKISQTPLPTPEEIRKERDRRRQLRLEQLEKLETIDQVVQSHQPLSRQTYASPRPLKRGNKLGPLPSGEDTAYQKGSNRNQISPHDGAANLGHKRPNKTSLSVESAPASQASKQALQVEPKSDLSSLKQTSKGGDFTLSQTAESIQLDLPAESKENHTFNQDSQEVNLNLNSESSNQDSTFDSLSSNVKPVTFDPNNLLSPLEVSEPAIDKETLSSGSESLSVPKDDLIGSETPTYRESFLDQTSKQVNLPDQVVDTLPVGPDANNFKDKIETTTKVHESANTSEDTRNTDSTILSLPPMDETTSAVTKSPVYENNGATHIADSLEEDILDKDESQLSAFRRLTGFLPFLNNKKTKQTDSQTKSINQDDVEVTQSDKLEDDLSSFLLTDMTQKEKVFFSFNVFFNVVKKIFIYFMLVGFLLGALAGGIGAGYFAYLVSQTPPPTKEEMQTQLSKVDQQSKLFYADGSQIASIRSDVVRTIAQLDEISPYIVDGLIATEDEYFYEHPGIVPKALLRATLQALLSSGAGTGGSTLTQQIVKQQMLTNDVTFFRKANEILLALRVENYFSKDEILTAYLNISPFGRNNSGDNIAGIYAASEGIFGKKPNEVNLAQAAFLVGLPQDPYSYTPYNQYGEIKEDLTDGINRMKEVLFRMYRTGKITKEEYESSLNYNIQADFQPTVQVAQERQSYLYQAMMNGAIEQIMRVNIEKQGLSWSQVSADAEWYNEYYFAAEEELRTGGYQVYTTIDKGIYDLLQEVAKANQGQLGISHDGVYTDPNTGAETYYVESVQSGVVVMDNQTGQVLGFVSGTDYENNQIDHAFGMRRSPGSTIKPLAVYGPAIEYNLINPATMIPDTPFEMTYEDGSTWAPTNYGYAISGNLLSARTALLRSDNLPAVRVYQQILESGVKTADFLRKMGFDMVDGYTEEDTQNLAFSLGGVTKGPTVFEQTRAFTTFANNGQYIGGYYISKIEDASGKVLYEHTSQPVQVFSEDTNYMVVDMLRDTNTQGTGRTAAANMVMGGDWIAKSGISEDSRDVWYIASTPSITIGTWIGYDNRYTDYYIDINDGYGRESERVQQYWASLANTLYNAYPNLFGTDRVFQQPESVVRTQVLENTGTLPGSISVNGTNLNISQPLKTDVFKVTNPAPPLTYNFIFNGSEADTQNFWQTYITQAQEAQRRQREQEQNRNRNNEETTTSQAETTTSAPQ